MAKRPRPPLSRNRELEHAVAEDPYDEERWLILQDWLLEQADTRAEIIRLDQAKRHAAAERVRRRLYPDLFGPDHVAITTVLYVLRWRASYMRECHYASNEVDTLALLSRAPCAALLRGITISMPRHHAQAMTVLAGSAFVDTLHELTLSNVDVAPPRVAAELIAGIPRLRKLALRGALVESPVVPQIAALVLAPTRHDVETLTPFVHDVQFPDVVDLELDLSNLANPPAIDIRSLAPLFTGAFAPRTRRFAIRVATVGIAREVIGLLATSPLLPQLRTIDLGRTHAREPLMRQFSGRFAHATVTVPDGAY